LWTPQKVKLHFREAQNQLVFLKWTQSTTLVHNAFMEVNIHEAEANFAKLLQRAEAGEEIIIARAGTPVAKLVPAEPKKKKRKLGIDAGKIYIADDFDAPLPDDILASFYGEDDTPKRAKKKTMRYLLDTGVFLWSLGGVGKLNREALELLSENREEVYLSAASSWEISLKHSLGKLQLPEPPPR
jgi:prevent-host-death family protein